MKNQIYKLTTLVLMIAAWACVMAPTAATSTTQTDPSTTILTYAIDDAPAVVTAVAEALGIQRIAEVRPHLYTRVNADRTIRTFDRERAERKFDEIAAICDGATRIVTDIEKKYRDVIRRPDDYSDVEVKEAVTQYIECWSWFRSHWPEAMIFEWNLVNARKSGVYTFGEELVMKHLDGFAIGVFYREEDPSGSVCVILGAGNVASIPPLDVLYKLFNEGEVAILKMNPVNEYLGEPLEEIFADFIDAGYLRFVYGGGDVGAYLTSHDGVDTIHITGSARTYNAIRYGVGKEGEANRMADKPISDKPISAELGGVSPTIVVPGDWSRADLRFQAENVVTQKMNNSGFNCVAAQILILPDSWDLTDVFLDEIRSVLGGLRDRDAYYPGTRDRCEAALAGSGAVEEFGGEAKRYLITGLDAEATQDAAFTTEYFAPVLSVVILPSPDIPSFVAAATSFANEVLVGTLGANIIVHPKTEKAYSDTIDRMIAGLRYGGIGVNTWSASVYLLSRCPWGAFPGNTPPDIGSGVGVVHNALMFGMPQKAVARGPFAPSHRTLTKGEIHLSPKPVFFVTNKQMHNVGERLVDFAVTGKTTDMLRIVSSAVRG